MYLNVGKFNKIISYLFNFLMTKWSCKLKVSVCTNLKLASKMAILLLLVEHGTVGATQSEDKYLYVRDEIWSELHRKLVASDFEGISNRRKRLRTLFSEVPAEFAFEFHSELGLTNTGGEFSQVFHHRLATSVRKKLSGILAGNSDANSSAGEIRVTKNNTRPAEITETKEERYLHIRHVIWNNLFQSLSSDETDELYQRRVRLRNVFSKVPVQFAAEFYQELGAVNTGGEYSNVFHTRLAKVVRDELLEILINITNNSTVRVPQNSNDSSRKSLKAPFFGSASLPVELESKLQSILQEDRQIIEALDRATKDRLRCMFDKLRTSTVDDRMIQWRAICPRDFAGPVKMSCELSGSNISQKALMDSINSQAEVSVAGANLGFIKHVRSLMVSLREFGPLADLNYIDINDQIYWTNHYLELMTTAPHGGGSMAADEYVYIKAWLREQQRNENSILSCFKN